MTKFKAYSSVLAICSLLGATLAQAATVERLGGSVRINKGSGFVTVSGSAELRPGDRIMADRKGTGRLVYPDGCVIQVTPGALVTVGEVSPCSLAIQQPLPGAPGPFSFLPGLGTGGSIAALGLLGAAGLGLGIGLGTGNKGTGFRFPIVALTPSSP